MKKTILLVGFNIIMFSLFSQTADSVSLLPSYKNQSYYDFSNGEVSNVDNTNWDLAFSVAGYGSSIRINGQTNTKLYVYPNGDINDWATLDTNGMSSWKTVNNSDESWSLGAFDQNADANNPMDLGWGIYSTVTHHITGDSLHVIQLSDGSYKKLHILKLSSGNFEFKYADIDGGNEVNASLDKSSFTDKNFGYYSLQTGSEIDREPSNQTWSLLFTKYVTEIMPGMTYGVTGVLTNDGYTVAKAENIDLANVDHNNFTNYESKINIIGYDWKSFNMTSFSYDLQDSLCYFVKSDATGNIWKINFTAFEGSATGKIVFNKEAVSTATIFDNSTVSSFTIYPNPSSDKNINLLYELNTNGVNKTGRITDMKGNIVFTFDLNGNGFNKKMLNLSHLKSGAYFLSSETENQIIREKLILQ